VLQIATTWKVILILILRVMKAAIPCNNESPSSSPLFTIFSYTADYEWDGDAFSSFYKDRFFQSESETVTVSWCGFALYRSWTLINVEPFVSNKDLFFRVYDEFKDEFFVVPSILVLEVDRFFGITFYCIHQIFVQIMHYWQTSVADDWKWVCRDEMHNHSTGHNAS
jgi:hypothetical protein